jgi:hypothetical protein
LNSNLFDHKAIHLTLVASNPVPSNVIYNSTINHSMFNYVVITSITDTYINHAAPGTPNLNEHSQVLGRAMYLIGCINNLEQEAATAAMNEEQTRRRELLQAELDGAISTLPGIDNLVEFALDAEPDVFFLRYCV